MSTTDYDVRMALYNLVSAINVTSVLPGGWAKTQPHLPKDVRVYPSLAVTSIRDEESTLDSRSDDVVFTMAVQIVDTWADASDAEDRISRLIPLIRRALRQQRGSATPLGGTAYALGSISGDWGADAGRGERWYQFNIEVKVTEDIV